MQLSRSGETLDRDNRAALALRGEQDARIDRGAFEEHRADAALRLQAVFLRADEAEVRPQHVQQSAVRLGQHVVRLPVDGEAQRNPGHGAPSLMRSRQRASARGTSVATRSAR